MHCDCWHLQIPVENPIAILRMPCLLHSLHTVGLLSKRYRKCSNAWSMRADRPHAIILEELLSG